jgi:glycosyltransferase involved in cell wall biosynthesis
MKVTYYHRKPQAGNYSIEGLFKEIRAQMPADVTCEVAVCKYPSKGILPRIYNIIEAKHRQGDVNHITGDIHFVSFLLTKRKTILTIHDCVFAQNYTGLKKLVAQVFWYIIPVKRSGIITVISEATKQDLLKYVRCNPEKIRVIPDCFSSIFQPNLKEFNTHDPRILHIGTGENKNLPRVIQALDGLKCHLDIVGHLNNEQQKLLQDYRISYSNTYDLTQQEISERYQQCDLVAFVSTFEGFGMPIIEANAVGRPVVTSKISPMKEVAGDAAYLVDPYDVADIRSGIINIMENSDLRSDLINNGLRNSSRFDSKAISAMYYELYKEILS